MSRAPKKDLAAAPQLSAGRELNVLVAERVLGWRYERAAYSNQPGFGWLRTEPSGRQSFNDEKIAPPCSTDIAAAWLVVEKWRERGDVFQLDSLGYNADRLDNKSLVWRCVFGWYADGRCDLFDAEADTAPLAICLAALRATAVLAERSDATPNAAKTDAGGSA